MYYKLVSWELVGPDNNISEFVVHKNVFIVSVSQAINS